MSTATRQRPPAAPPPPLGPVGTARWAWRQLTSMRVALLLLFLLALAAIPGSLLPQRPTNPLEVQALVEQHPELAAWYDRVGLFDVYAAPWFAAIYLLLFVSLVGCIVPRSRQHWRALRARPPRAPHRLDRLPSHAAEVLPGVAPAEALAAARAALTSRRYRVDAHAGPGGGSLAAERGHLRETGNLLFHLALVVVLASVAVGSLYGYRASVIVPEGQGFANSVIQYDDLSPGALFDPADLPPFSLTLDEFEMDFVDSGAQLGQPQEFAAHVRYVPAPGAAEQRRIIRVNEPLATGGWFGTSVGGTLVHALNPGYAPVVTVRDAAGAVLFQAPVPFLPQDGNFASTGVVKVPVPPGVGTGEDLGLQAIFLPTAVLGADGPQSVFPEPRSPQLFLTAFSGDLGLDSGQPQSVYRLDTAAMTQLTQPGVDGAGAQPFRVALRPGESVDLPGGHGSVTFDGYRRWVNFQVSRNAGKELALLGAVLAVAGLCASLFVRRRRVWVRVDGGAAGRTVVTVAGLDRAEGGDLDAEVGALLQQIRHNASALTHPEASPAAGATERPTEDT